MSDLPIVVAGPARPSSSRDTRSVISNSQRTQISNCSNLEQKIKEIKRVLTFMERKRLQSNPAYAILKKTHETLNTVVFSLKQNPFPSNIPSSNNIHLEMHKFITFHLRTVFDPYLNSIMTSQDTSITSTNLQQLFYNMFLFTFLKIKQTDPSYTETSFVQSILSIFPHEALLECLTHEYTHFPALTDKIKTKNSQDLIVQRYYQTNACIMDAFGNTNDAVFRLLCTQEGFVGNTLFSPSYKESLPKENVYSLATQSAGLFKFTNKTMVPARYPLKDFTSTWAGRLLKKHVQPNQLLSPLTASETAELHEIVSSFSIPLFTC